MEITEGLKWNGIVDLFVIKNNKIIRKMQVHNTVTNYARQYMVYMLTNVISYPLLIPSKMELGTGTGTPAGTDTDLWTPASATLKLISNMQPYQSYFAQYVCTWQTTDSIQGTWTEIGLKDTNNNLWAHASLPSFVINTGEMLVAQWAIQILGN
jgi:hypothetical protein